MAAKFETMDTVGRRDDKQAPERMVTDSKLVNEAGEKDHIMENNSKAQLEDGKEESEDGKCFL